MNTGGKGVGAWPRIHISVRLARSAIAIVLCVATMLGCLDTAGAVTDAFDRDGELTFGSYRAQAGWRTAGWINDPPDPTDPDPSNRTWRHWDLDDEAVFSWQDDYQVQFYYDNVLTTSQYIWPGYAAGELGSGYIDGSLVLPSASGGNIVEVARSQLGVREVPARSNKVGYVAWYNGWADVNAHDCTSWPWCCIFVIWCADQCGLLDGGAVFSRTASCSYQSSYMRNTLGCSWIYVSEVWNDTTKQATISPGDILFFSKSKDPNSCQHIGIIEEAGVDVSGNFYIQTIEGNTSGGCDPAGVGTPGGGVCRQRFYRYTNYTGMQNGFIVRPHYPD